MIITAHDALLIIDVQNDFLDGGALAVPNGTEVVEPINRLAHKPFGAIIASQDWHPARHCSFKEQEGPWPVHCVAGTSGAKFPLLLDERPITQIIRKGTSPSRDSYSAFLDNDRETKTGLDGLLKNLGIQRVFITGVALDYCVAATAFDAANLGYEVHVIPEACRSIADDCSDLFSKFEKATIRLTDLAKI